MLDLRRLDFMDRSGLSVLDAAATRTRVAEERFRVVRGPLNRTSCGSVWWFSSSGWPT